MSHKKEKLIILHTNDFHSNFDNAANVASTINSLRKQYASSEILTIDCGDHIERMSLETESTEGLANIKIMNDMGFDAVVPGNREGLVFYPEVLERAYEEAEFEVLCSNIMLEKTGEYPSWAKPYHIVVKGSISVGMIGVTACFPQFYSSLGWDIRDPYTAVAQIVEQIRSKVDVLIVLSHLGLESDEELAMKVKGIDVIIGAHTHHLLEQPRKVNNTYLCGAGELGEHVGVVQFDYDLLAKNMPSVSGYVVSTAAYDPDLDIMQKVAQYHKEALEKLGTPLFALETSLSVSQTSESYLGNLLAAGIREWVDAEIGIINSGQLLGELQAGPVSVLKMMEICPTPAKPCSVLLTGRQIQIAMEAALLPETTGKKINKYSFQGITIGTLCVDGLQISYDASRPPFQKIDSIKVNGQPLLEEKRYKVGTIDAFMFGFGYPSLTDGEQIRYHYPTFIREILLIQLQNPEHIKKSKQQRWFGK